MMKLIYLFNTDESHESDETVNIQPRFHLKNGF